MPRKHIAYYRVLEALDRPGCPVCGLVEEDIRRRVEWIFHEHVNDPGVRRKLVESRGFCARHSEILLELGHPLGVAIIYRDIVDSISGDLKHASVSSRPGKQRAKCLACELIERNEQQYLSVVAEHLTKEELRAGILASRGLCIPHLRKLLGLLSPREQNELKRGVLLQLSELRSELSEIVRKSDYRCEEPWGSEGDAWIRAVRKVSGRTM